MLFSMAVLLVALAASDGGAVPASPPGHRAVIPPDAFTVFREDSGPVNYYSVGEDGGTAILRAVYRPGLGNVVLNARVPEAARQAVRSVSWRWRAHVLPKEANDCGPGASDAAASVFLAFKAGLKLMVIKYVWSTVGNVGTSCQSNRGWFFDRDTTLVQVGGPLDVWTSYTMDPRREFVKHYGGKLEGVPDFVAIGVMTDGDNSQSPAEADYADFVVEW
ncbi:MAG: DUF3047 domain-containing protein [Myxococcaceae bacterium]|nr:MAG: DUF3047 domain-containing protein [Myxococcaceae bacterium]